MTEEPEVDDILDITGPEGETLFWHAKQWLLAGHEKIQEDANELWEHYRDVGDDRLLALIGALCVESVLDDLIVAIAPGFKDLRSDTDFKFSVKIKLARSLRLFPARILTGADLVRQIRNSFAHDVGIQRFADLDPKLKNKLGPHVQGFSKKARNENDLCLLFRELIGFLILSLRLYRDHVSALRTFVEATEGREAFADWAKKKGLGIE